MVGSIGSLLIRGVCHQKNKQTCLLLKHGRPLENWPLQAACDDQSVFQVTTKSVWKKREKMTKIIYIKT